MTLRKRIAISIVGLTAVLGLFGGEILLSRSAAQKEGALKGEIKIDGSSTVYLITEAVASNFKKLHPDVNLSVGISGTGGGFKKFAAGETDIQDASRKVKDVEAAACKAKGVEYTELQIAWDGLAVVIHKENDWARKLTVAQLKKIWHPDSAAKKWSDVDPAWPNEEIKLFGPGPESGTFDYFTEAINGKEKVSRTDYTASENDNDLVQGVARNKYALGYFGLAYYEAHTDKLQVASISAKEGADFVAPTAANVLSRAYTPLSRPLYLYVKHSSLARPEVKEFVSFYLRRTDIVASVKYVPLSALQANKTKKAFEEAVKAASK